MGARVKEVRREGGRVLYIVIENGPFDLTFIKRKNKPRLWEFVRFDGAQDGGSWVPSYIFYPAVKVAAAIFAKGK